ncbi:MAG: RNA polymerase factor sigma-54 [Treponema sp.]|nr:RNA polymerase factor sigma-54 [Treponema sp.]
MSDLAQRQTQSQKQIQKMSQVQIQALKILAMNSRDLRQEIYRAVEENPALEIVNESEKKSARLQNEYSNRTTSSGAEAADANQRVLEAQADRGETLQQHLMAQLELMKIPRDEYELCQKLIYNLDENGCYGSSLAPETLLDKSHPTQNKKMLERCLDRIQRMDPVGTCCRTLEESLLIQARIAGDAPQLALFILDGHLELLSPPQPDRVLKKVLEYQKNWHSKTFARELPIDKISLDEDAAEEAIKYILTLNPRPAGEYVSDTSKADFFRPDVVLTVERVPGAVPSDNFANGIVSGDSSCHFQITYSSGDIPQVRLAQNINFDKILVQQAQAFLQQLQYRESTLALQGCAIVAAQKEFFLHGPGNLVPLTRRQIAKQLGIHESTVSRVSGKKSNRYIQTEWGLFPAEYFFVSGVKTTAGTNASAEKIKAVISDMITSSARPLSDQALTNQLNAQGIKISRRTVNKYRNQLGANNSYNQKSTR